MKRPSKKIRKKITWPFLTHKISTTDITRFSRQLATLLTASIPLIQALDLLKHGHNKTVMQDLIDSLKTTLEKGGSVTEALSKYPQHFNALYRNLINVGERTGELDHMFDRIASYKEKTDLLKQKIKKALFYPAAVLFVAILVTVAMLIFVVPQFIALFAGFGAQLPFATRVIVALSQFLQQHGWLLLIFIVLLSVSLRWIISRSTHFANQIDIVLLKLPLIGHILVKAIVARFTRTLATTFAAGLPLADALEAVAGATGNNLYAQATLHIRENVVTGQSLQQALQQTNLFSSLVIQMIDIGEESGTLDAMLNKVATMFEEEVERAADNFGNLLEPLIMIILGIIIGSLVIAMYLPIFKLGSVI
jgi:type IV pilus assembly protein PilC